MCHNKVFSHTQDFIPHGYVCFLTESSIKIPGVPDEVRKQFKEMILKEKDLAPAGDAQPATDSNDGTSNGMTSVIFS